MNEPRQLGNITTLPSRPNAAEGESSTALVLTSETMKRAESAARTLESWLTPMGWIVNTPQVIRDAAPRALSLMEAVNRPASRKEMAVALDKLFAFAESLGKGPKDYTTTTRTWAEALEDIPPDLLMEGVNRTVKSHGFNTLPGPGEIREKIADDLARRKRWLALARKATR